MTRKQMRAALVAKLEIAKHEERTLKHDTTRNALPLARVGGMIDGYYAALALIEQA